MMITAGDLSATLSLFMVMMLHNEPKRWLLFCFDGTGRDWKLCLALSEPRELLQPLEVITNNTIPPFRVKTGKKRNMPGNTHTDFPAFASAIGEKWKPA